MTSTPTLATRRPSGTTGLPPTAAPVIGRRVSAPRVLLGAVLVLGFALAGAAVADRVDTRLPVLATARNIGAGQTIADTDVTVVRVAAEAGVATLPSAQRSSVVGRTAAVPLAAGTLLHTAQLGAPAWPPAGQAVIAVGVKPGRAPDGLAAGMRVTVLVVPGSGTASGSTGPAAGSPVVRADATVVSVRSAADQSGAQVVSLVLADSDAMRVAAAIGEPVLALLGTGR